MLFDTHAHLNDEAFNADREALLAGLQEKGIGLVMNAGCSLEASREVVQMAKQYPWLYAAVGSHPDSADEVNEEVLEEYRKLCKLNPEVKAIGEIGLDYHYEDIPREIQQKAFRMQMELARELDLPVIVHERDAHEDGMETAASIPLDRIVLETDCPYMAPEPFRGKRNDPGYLYRMAEQLAAIRGITPQEAAAITTENGKKLYRIM